MKITNKLVAFAASAAIAVSGFAGVTSVSAADSYAQDGATQVLEASGMYSISPGASYNYSTMSEKMIGFSWADFGINTSETIEKVLILSGGSDPYDAISKILESIERPQYKEIYVICGIYNERYEKLCQLYGQENNVFVYQGVTNIEKYMKKVDVAISAGGTTLYELCACGTPTISYSFADNQLNNVKQFDEDGIIPYAGDVRYEDISLSIRNNIKKMMNDVSLRQAISDRMQTLVDGKGAMRIASQICK